MLTYCAGSGLLSLGSTKRTDLPAGLVSPTGLGWRVVPSSYSADESGLFVCLAYREQTGEVKGKQEQEHGYTKET